MPTNSLERRTARAAVARACSRKRRGAPRRQARPQHGAAMLGMPIRDKVLVHEVWTVVIETCSLCLTLAIIALTEAQVAIQWGDTIRMCNPGLGGCNDGF